MRQPKSFLGYVLLFIPVVLAFLAVDSPSASYWIAWLGSWYILYYSLSGHVKPLPGVKKWSDMIFRPLALTQIIFVGYMALSSIFRFLDLNGYYYLQIDPTFVRSSYDLAISAQIQRYYLLAHACVTTGILLMSNYRNSGRWRIRYAENLPKFLFFVSTGSLAAASIISYVPGIEQLVPRLQSLSLVAAAAGLAFSFRTKQRAYLIATSIIYAASVFHALGTGWKEPVLIAFIVLSVYFYSFYKIAVLLISPVVLTALLLILPTYVNTVRSLSWTPDSYYDRSEVVNAAFEQLQTSTNSDDMMRTNWGFLTGRITEASLFKIYIEHVPTVNGYYGWQIPRQVVMSLVPRVFWPAKPSVERMVMERVYENNVVARSSTVSAKPQYVADGYLMFGTWGIIISSLIFGMSASMASRLCERWFGGYLLGSGLIYTGVFIEFWRGNSFEFFFSTMFWNFVLISMLFVAGRFSNVLVRDDEWRGSAP